jgi:hypothetical protein
MLPKHSEMMYAHFDSENKKSPVNSLNLSLFKLTLTSPHFTFPMLGTHESKLSISSLTDIGKHAWS